MITNSYTELVKNKLCQTNTIPSLEKMTDIADSVTLWYRVLFGHWMLTYIVFNKQRWYGLGLTLGLSGGASQTGENQAPGPLQTLPWHRHEGTVCCVTWCWSQTCWDVLFESTVLLWPHGNTQVFNWKHSRGNIKGGLLRIQVLALHTTGTGISCPRPNHRPADLGWTIPLLSKEELKGE